MFIEINERCGFLYVRSDRGALEFVAKDDEIWEKRLKFCDLHSLDAFSYCGSVFWPSRESMERIEVLKHELSHVDDYRRLGFILNAIMYSICDVLYGYENNPFEVKAREAEKK